MGYRVLYGCGERKPANRKGFPRLSALVLLWLALFWVLVQTSWPDGAALLRERLFLPGEAAAVAAWNVLAEQLQGGKPLAEAFWEFSGKLLP